jgi:hypothetical protein
MKRIFGPERGEMMGGWGRLHNEGVLEQGG